MAIMGKAFEDHNNNPIFTSTNYILRLNKFALKVFNQMLHYCQVNMPLIVSYLLDLLLTCSTRIILTSR